MVLKTTYGKVSSITSQASSSENEPQTAPLPKIGPKLDLGQFQPVRW